jgi:phosphonate transport system substrate-binding protein
MTILEFLEVESFASQSLVMDDANARGGDEYLLLVHEDSGIKILADLRRKSVNVFDNPKMCLAAMWLETAFLSANLGAPQEFVGRIALQNKLSRAVLPVYFRQSDACVVTRRGFATMCELNPQLGRKLHVLASSPNLITGLMAFHKDFAFERRQKLQAALVGLNKTTAGQQALTLFESGPLVVVDASVLRTTLDLVKTHEQLLRKAVPARK